MIKLIAAVTMLIDHVGIFFFPRYIIFRIVGRIAMPLYAFCIARGYYYSKKKGTVNKYLKNLAISAVLVQIPLFFFYFFAIKKLFYLNIIFVWFFSVLFLKCLENIKYPIDKKSAMLIAAVILIILFTILVPMDYGFYAMLVAVFLYISLFKMQNSLVCLIGNFFIYLVHILQVKLKGLLFNEKISNFYFSSDFQFYSIIAIFLLLFLNYSKDKDILPRRFFYWFYPMHIVVLIVIKSILQKDFLSGKMAELFNIFV